MIFLCKLFSGHSLTALSCVDPCPDKISKTNETGTGVLAIYPQADMLLSTRNPKSFSTFSEWGKGWADPEIRRQRLKRRGAQRKPKNRKKKSRKHQPNTKTVRGRLEAKLSIQKQ